MIEQPLRKHILDITLERPCLMSDHWFRSNYNYLLGQEDEKISLPNEILETDVSSSEGSFDGYNQHFTTYGKSSKERPQKRVPLCRKQIVLNESGEESCESEAFETLESANFFQYNTKNESDEYNPLFYEILSSIKAKDESHKERSKRKRKQTNFFTPDKEGIPRYDRGALAFQESILKNKPRESVGITYLKSNEKIPGRKRKQTNFFTPGTEELVKEHFKNLLQRKVFPTCSQDRTGIEDCLMPKKRQESGQNTKKKCRKRHKITDQMHVSIIRKSNKKGELTGEVKEQRKLTSKDSTIRQRRENILQTLQEKKDETPPRILFHKPAQIRTGEDIKFDKEYAWMEIDDTASLVYRASYAKLQIVSAKDALSFFHQLFRETYAKIDEAMLELCRHDFKCKRSGIFSLRNRVVGLWCGYVRILMEIAAQASSHETQSSSSIFSKCNSSQISELQDALFDFALIILSLARRCSLAGNHAFISLSYSRVSLFRKKLFANNGVTMSRSHKNTIDTHNADPSFDRSVIDTLVRFDILDRSVVTSLFDRVNNRILRGQFLFKDESSDNILHQEKNKILLLCENGSEITHDQTHITNNDVTALLSCFPALKHDRILPFETWSKDEDLKEERNGKFCFDVEIIERIETIPTPTSGSASFSDHFRHQDAIKKEKAAINIENLDNNCSNVEFYCKWCKISKAFTSELDLSSHMPHCSTRQKATRAAQSFVKFGNAKLSNNRRITSFNPEIVWSNDDLLDVLDYSVDFFEATRVTNGLEATNCDEISAPHFDGQVGLRCRHCIGKTETAGCSIFPRSIDEISKSFWLLSLLHLDQCQNQPKKCRKRHQSFRQRFCLSSPVTAEYWKRNALQANVAESNKGRGLICRGNY